MTLDVCRSISIFDGKTGELVWDSGDFIEQFIADPANGFSDIFNSQGGKPYIVSGTFLRTMIFCLVRSIAFFPLLRGR